MKKVKKFLVMFLAAAMIISGAVPSAAIAGADMEEAFDQPAATTEVDAAAAGAVSEELEQGNEDSFDSSDTEGNDQAVNNENPANDAASENADSQDASVQNVPADTGSQDGQTGSQESQTGSQDNQTGSQDNQTGSQEDQNSGQTASGSADANAQNPDDTNNGTSQPEENGSGAGQQDKENSGQASEEDGSEQTSGAESGDTGKTGGNVSAASGEVSNGTGTGEETGNTNTQGSEDASDAGNTNTGGSEDASDPGVISDGTDEQKKTSEEEAGQGSTSEDAINRGSSSDNADGQEKSEGEDPQEKKNDPAADGDDVNESKEEAGDAAASGDDEEQTEEGGEAADEDAADAGQENAQETRAAQEQDDLSSDDKASAGTETGENAEMNESASDVSKAKQEDVSEKDNKDSDHADEEQDKEEEPDGEEEPAETVAVTFLVPDEEGEFVVLGEPVAVEKDSAIGDKLPEVPERELYTFTRWRDGSGNTINAETIAASDMEVFADYHDDYPAFTAQSVDTGDMTVTVHVPRGALPEVVMVRMRTVRPDQIAEQADVDKDRVTAVDITFIDPFTRDEIQPLIPVELEVAVYGLEGAGSYQAVRLEDNGSLTMIGSESTDPEFTIDAEHFTVYGVIGGNYKDDVTQKARYTYQFYDGNTLVSTQVVHNGDKLVKPAVDLGGRIHSFVGWYLRDINGELTVPIDFDLPVTISKDETVDRTIQVEAKYDEGLYTVTLYRDASLKTVFMTFTGKNGEKIELPVDEDELKVHGFTLENGTVLTGWKKTGDPDEKAVDTVTVDGADIELVPVIKDAGKVEFIVNPQEYKGISFEIHSQHIVPGGTATEPNIPETGKDYDGYMFLGWYAEKPAYDESTKEYTYNENAKWDFSKEITQDLVLYAKWEPLTVSFTVEIWLEKNDGSGEFEKWVKEPKASVVFNGKTGASLNDYIDVFKNHDESLKVSSGSYDVIHNSNWHFHLGGEGVFDGAEEPNAFQVYQRIDGELVNTANYSVRSNSWVGDPEKTDNTIHGNGETVVRIYDCRDTYTIRFLFRTEDGSGTLVNELNGTNGSNYLSSLSGYTHVSDKHKEDTKPLNSVSDEETYADDLTNEIYTIKFRQNMYRTIYLNSKNIPILMGNGNWVFNGEYKYKSGAAKFDESNSSYNLLPHVNAKDGDKMVCTIYHNPDQRAYPFVNVYYQPDRKTKIEGKEYSRSVVYPDKTHSHTFSMGSVNGGYKLEKITTGTKTYAAPGYVDNETENIIYKSGNFAFPFEYDSDGKPLNMVLHYYPLKYQITFIPGDGTDPIQAVNTKRVNAESEENTVFYVDDDISFVATGEGQGAAAYQPGTRKRINGILKEFKGWVTNKDGSGEVYNFEHKTMPAKDLTVYGKWDPVSVTVVFHKNDGSENDIIDEKTVLNGLAAARPGNPERAGYLFGGWYTAPGCSEADAYGFDTVLDEETVNTLKGTDGKIHLYAEWNSDKPYTVVYDANGGDLSEALKQKLNGSNADPYKYLANDNALALVKGNASLKGSVFIGWTIGRPDSLQKGALLLQNGDTFHISSTNDEADGKSDQVITLVAQYSNMPSTNLTYHSNYPGEADKTIVEKNLPVNGTFSVADGGILKGLVPEKQPARYEFVCWTNEPGEQIFSNSPGRDYFYPGEEGALETSSNDLYAVWIEVTPDPEEEITYTSITVTKIWDDNNNQAGLRPHEICVRLHADGVEIDSVRMSVAGDWYPVTFSDLPEYDGEHRIEYTITEDHVENYEHVIDQETYTITNFFAPGKTEIDVEKHWEDDDDFDKIRPDHVTVHLMAQGRDTGKTLVLNASNKWYGVFMDLDEYNEDGERIEYSVREETVEEYECYLSGDMDHGFVLKNVHIPEDDPNYDPEIKEEPVDYIDVPIPEPVTPVPVTPVPVTPVPVTPEPAPQVQPQPSPEQPPTVVPVPETPQREFLPVPEDGPLAEVPERNIVTQQLIELDNYLTPLGLGQFLAHAGDYIE